ncbi:hypothetical protein [Pyruvatibacter mobilis]|uniref:hypothetical protein n=1 Tax=Pyruvatibacter mobilis TaxID=1712261 RepID=UPI003BA868BB
MKTAVLRAAARLESLSRVSLRESVIAGIPKTTVLELPPGWSPYLGSLCENRFRPALHAWAQNSAFGEHLVENRRFESCRHAGILISGLFERIGNARLCMLKHKIALLESIWLKIAVLRAAARLESLFRASWKESEIAGFA